MFLTSISEQELYDVLVNKLNVSPGKAGALINKAIAQYTVYEGGIYIAYLNERFYLTSSGEMML